MFIYPLEQIKFTLGRLSKVLVEKRITSSNRCCPYTYIDNNPSKIDNYIANSQGLFALFILKEYSQLCLGTFT